MFDNLTAYERVKKSGIINAARIAEAYRVRVDDVLVCRPYDAAVAFKITLRRPVPCDVGDWDDVGGASRRGGACVALAGQSISGTSGDQKLNRRRKIKLTSDPIVVDYERAKSVVNLSAYERQLLELARARMHHVAEMLPPDAPAAFVALKRSPSSTRLASGD
jgi:hypothetical protein